MSGVESRVRGRRAFQDNAWADACAWLSAADRERPLEPEDLERLATSTYLTGRYLESTDVWSRAHRGFLDRGDAPGAARCAFWLAYGLFRRGDRARGAGWIARAHRLLDEGRHDCVVQGYLLLPHGMKLIIAGDTPGAYAMFCRVAEIGSRFADSDLIALARHNQGRVLIRMGEIEPGVTLLDEAMAAVEAGDLSPMVVGDVYCSVIEGCLEIFDIRRAQEWTSALTRWCDSQPDLVPYRGWCLVRRAQIMQLHGAWPAALEEARRVCERFARPPAEPATGAAYYRQAELHRLRGEFAEAEEAYRQASQWGRRPQPGLAQMRLAQGQNRAAEAAIRRVEEEATAPMTRSRILPAYIEIMLAVDDVPAARAAVLELAKLAGAMDAAFLRTVAEHAQGAVLLAEGDHRGALDVLRRVWRVWEDLPAPYEAARARELIGLACRGLGDEDTAEMELDAAGFLFRQLGAAPDLDRVDALRRPEGSAQEAPTEEIHDLTPRQLEVLRLVATGETNKGIAARLFISERTVERHMSNIFQKLDVSSRAQATAYAYEHRLV